jgi:hypothetical protein
MLRVLVALDFSDCSRVALSEAFLLADRWSPTSMLLLTVIPEQPDVGEGMDLVEQSVDDLRRMVRAVRGERPSPAGLTVQFAAVQGVAAEAIVSLTATVKVVVSVLPTATRLSVGSKARVRMAAVAAVAVPVKE